MTQQTDNQSAHARLTVILLGSPIVAEIYRLRVLSIVLPVWDNTPSQAMEACMLPGRAP